MYTHTATHPCIPLRIPTYGQSPQVSGLFLVPLNIRCPNIIHNQKGHTVLRTTQITSFFFSIIPIQPLYCPYITLHNTIVSIFPLSLDNPYFTPCNPLYVIVSILCSITVQPIYKASEKSLLHPQEASLSIPISSPHLAGCLGFRGLGV